MPLTIFKEDYVTKLRHQLKRGHRDAIERVRAIPFQYQDADTITFQTYPDLKNVVLLNETAGKDFEFKNGVTIFESLPITTYEASNPCLWSYLALVTFRSYTASRSPFPEDKMEKGELNVVGEFLVRHYLCDGAAVGALLLNDISLLWWITHLTYQHDAIGDDRYRLTKEAFSMLDYTRHLLPGTQGRSVALRHAVLEFVVENPSLFNNRKAEKVRFIMRRLNALAGYQLFPFYSKSDIKNFMLTIREDLSNGNIDE
jgi:hypothetical protein